MSRGCRVVAACLALAGCDAVLRLDTIETIQPSPRAIVFANAASLVDLSQFPVLVPLEPGDLAYARISDPARDLRFHDEATNEDLPFEIEHWDPATESLVWVKVPTIHAGSTTDRILLYYGADAGGAEDAAGVWADYDLVFHGDALVDSTGKSTPTLRPDTTGALPTIAPGMIGNGVAFSGGNGQRVELANHPDLMSLWSQFTIELCVQPTYAPDPYNLGTTNNGATPIEPTVFGKPGGAVQNGRLRNTTQGVPSPLLMQTDFYWASGLRLEGQVAPYIPDGGEWSQVTFAYDGKDLLWWYRNGTALDFYTMPGPQMTVADPNGESMVLGGGEGPLLGMIDEMRITHVYHDVNWVFAQYLSMTKHFVTIGAP